METTIRITTPDDIVAHIPYRLGFRPRESVVLLGLRRSGNRLGLVSRVDLADIGHPAIGRHVMAEMAELMAQDGCDDVFVVLYSDLPRDALARDPVVGCALEHLRTLSDWADPPGPWVVGAQTYGCWGDGEQCAPATTDVARLEQGAMAATMVLHGHGVVTGRDALAIPPTADTGRRRSATRAARDAQRRRSQIQARCGGGAARPGAAFGCPGAVAAVDQQEMTEWREGERRRWARLIALASSDAVLPASELGRLAVGLEDGPVRDGALCSLIRELPPRVPAPAVVERTLDLAVLPGGPSPALERVEPAATVLRSLVACTSRRRGALALGLLAWLAWWCGDGARADVLAQQALHARPGTRLAELVDQALQARVPPGWVSGALEDDPAAATIR